MNEGTGGYSGGDTAGGSGGQGGTYRDIVQGNVSLQLSQSRKPCGQRERVGEEKHGNGDTRATNSVVDPARVAHAAESRARKRARYSAGTDRCAGARAGPG